MIKKSILILAFTFLFTACAERGAVLVDKSNNIDKANNNVSIDVRIIEENSSIHKMVLSNSNEEAVKNTLSGSLVFIIALIILL